MVALLKIGKSALMLVSNEPELGAALANLCRVQLL